MTKDDLKCVCNGSGYINDPELGNLICGCTFNKSGLGNRPPGEVFSFGEPKYVGKMPPSGLVPCKPCTHPGCRSHKSHPCEECGRQWGKTEPEQYRPCTVAGCKGTQKLTAMTDFKTKTSCGDWWRCNSCLFEEKKVSPKKKTVHAIAHFDFDGSCDACPCHYEDPEVYYKPRCMLSENQFDTSRVKKGARHKHCPLCIEED